MFKTEKFLEENFPFNLEEIGIRKWLSLTNDTMKIFPISGDLIGGDQSQSLRELIITVLKISTSSDFNF